VKVLDFGLVKSGGDNHTTQVSLTQNHHVGGTPGFMAPEQVLGNHAIDGRSDLYSVGCLAYWLVTGQLVFTGRTVMDTLVQHAQAKPVPPSQRTELRIPAALDEVILACLEKNPADRPPTAEILAARLCRIEKTGSWTNEVMRQWWEAHHPLIDTT
jgi:serine/threonine-protein kinase